MPNSTANVSTGKPKVSGAIFVAPLTATAPTDATTALGSDFKCLGYASDDGVTNSYSSDSDNIKAWGGNTVGSINSNKTDTFKTTLIECLNADVLKTVYGSSAVTVAEGGGISIAVGSHDTENLIFVVDMLLNGNKAKRIVIPNGKVTEVGEIAYKDDEAIGYETTITAMTDTSGNTHYEYIA